MPSSTTPGSVDREQTGHRRGSRGHRELERTGDRDGHRAGELDRHGCGADVGVGRGELEGGPERAVGTGGPAARLLRGDGRPVERVRRGGHGERHVVADVRGVADGRRIGRRRRWRWGLLFALLLGEGLRDAEASPRRRRSPPAAASPREVSPAGSRSRPRTRGGSRCPVRRHLRSGSSPRWSPRRCAPWPAMPKSVRASVPAPRPDAGCGRWGRQRAGRARQQRRSGPARRQAARSGRGRRPPTSPQIVAPSRVEPTERPIATTNAIAMMARIGSLRPVAARSAARYAAIGLAGSSTAAGNISIAVAVRRPNQANGMAAKPKVLQPGQLGRGIRLTAAHQRDDPAHRESGQADDRDQRGEDETHDDQEERDRDRADGREQPREPPADGAPDPRAPDRRARRRSPRRWLRNPP